MVKSLDERAIRRLGSEAFDCLVMADMGSSYLRQLEDLDARVIVLDHHTLQGDSEKVIYVNPHIWGIDGMTGSSASAVCMLLAAQMSDENWDLLPVAFAGVVGDRQHIRGLSGLNSILLAEGERRGLVEVREGSLLPSGQLRGALSASIDPYIIGVSGNEKGAESLLASAGLELDVTLEGLGEAQRRKLASLLALALMKQGCTLQTLEELSHDRYYFPQRRAFASDLASLLNACGRTDHESVGLGCALGDERSIKDASALKKKYRSSVLEGLRRIETKGLEKMEHIQHFRSESPSLAGILCGLSMQYIGDKDKPTIALSEGGDVTRVSSRATFEILATGVDLATALRDTSSAVGGVGGGHAIASGATIPKGREEEFLRRLNDIIRDQKRRKAKA